jgi:O-antigen ligase
MFVFVLMISVSYWYCLPVTTQSIIMYSEFRGYDFLLMLLTIVLVFKYWQKLKLFFRHDKPGQWILRFSIWASITFIMTIVHILMYRQTFYILMTFVMLFHLWGFVLAYAAVRIFVTERRQCFALLDAFLVAGLIEALIITFQGTRILPLFWSEAYQLAYGADAFSGTLGPNRQLPGHTMILVFAVATGYWRNAGTVGIPRLVLAAAAALSSLTALGLSGSRTAWVSFVVFCAVVLIGRRPQLGMIVFVLVIGLGAVWFLPDQVGVRVNEVYQDRFVSKLARAEEDADALEKFQQVDAGRYKDWVGGLNGLIARPWLIPFGGGFNNYRSLIWVDISAHNIYITLIVETGLVGLFLYLMWLKSIARESQKLMALSRKRKKPDKAVFMGVEMRALLVALMVSLFAGEILYPYRPAFAFLGMFLFLAAVMNHPLLVFGNRQTLGAMRRRIYSKATAGGRIAA